MQPRRVSPLVFVLAFTILALSGCFAPEDKPEPNEVFMEVGNVFVPQTIEVVAGTEVTWINKDGVPHTATADDGSWDSKYLNRGMDWSRTFDESGTYSYHCIPHAIEEGGEYRGMIGTVIVVDGNGSEGNMSSET